MDTTQDAAFTGVPDGLTTDNEGFLWVSLYHGSGVVKVDPKNGRILDRIDVPALLTTTPSFAGPNLTDVYLTTAYRGLSDKERQDQPDSGRVFKLTAVSQGVKEAYRYKP